MFLLQSGRIRSTRSRSMDFDEDVYFKKHSKECLEPDICPYLVGRKLVREGKKREKQSRQNELQKSATDFRTQSKESYSQTGAQNQSHSIPQSRARRQLTNLEFPGTFRSVQSLTEAVNKHSLEKNGYSSPKPGTSQTTCKHRASR